MRSSYSLFAATAMCAAVLACHRGARGSSTPPDDELWIAPGSAGHTLARAEVRDMPQVVSAPGRIAFHDLHVTHVFSPVTGRVSRVLAQPGDRVRRGSPLVSILSPDVGSAFSDLVKADADVRQTEAEFQRQQMLAAVHAASQRDLEAAEDAYRKARAEHERARQKAALLRSGSVNAVTQEYTLRSFIDGEVMARQVNPGVEVQGQYAGGQSVELFTIGDIRRVWVLADVAEADLQRIQIGADVTLRVAAYVGRTFHGNVEWISETLDPALRTAKVRASVANEDEALKAEMYAQVSIATAPRRALAIPRQAMTTIGGRAFAWVAAGARPDGRSVMKRRLLKVVDAGGNLVEVTEGLSPGDPVLVDEAVARDPGAEQAVLSERQVAAAGIEVLPVRAQDVPDAVALGGRITFHDLHVTHVFSPVNGRVTKVLAQPGQRLRKGAPLAAILSPDLGSAASDVFKAEADRAQADQELRRQRDLYEAHAGARRDLEAAENAFRKAQAEAERARQKTALLRGGVIDAVTQEYVLTSPIDGEVVSRTVNPGMEVQGQYSGSSSSVELFTVGDTARLLVLAEAYEVDLLRIHEGDAVSIRVAAYPGRTFHGTIEWISDVLDPQLRTAKVRCAADNPDHLLKPEMYEGVTVDVPGREVLAVPRTALLRVGDDTVVFVETGANRDGKRVFERRRVAADEGHAGALVPITGEVRPGDRVVVRGAIYLLGVL